MRYDYSSIGFYTFDCLGWPFTSVPERGGTHFLDELTLAVSGAAGTAAIAAAKMGLKVLAVGGVGPDLMGDWVLERLRSFSVDISAMQRIEGSRTSSSIVTPSQMNVWLEILQRAPIDAPRWISTKSPICAPSPIRHP